VYFSVTTLDNRLAARMEPRASAPHAKLRAMRRLHDAGVPVGVMVAPVVPIGALARYDRPAPPLSGYDDLLNTPTAPTARTAP